MTMGEFIAQAVDNELHPKIQMTQEEPMERMRTLAFQVPDSLCPLPAKIDRKKVKKTE